MTQGSTAQTRRRARREAATSKPRAGQRRALARLAKALGHPVRVRILRLVSRRSGCVHGDIAVQFRLARSTVAEHLRILKQAGWIRGHIAGPNVCYCLDVSAVERMRDLLALLHGPSTCPSPESRS